jgi:hypothetical protein
MFRQPQLDFSGDNDKLYDAQRTRTGALAFLLGAAFMILGTVLSIPSISFVGNILYVIGYVIVFIGIFLIFQGRKTLDRKHIRNVNISMVLLGFWLLFIVVHLFVYLLAWLDMTMKWSETGQYGDEVATSLSIWKFLAWSQIIPTILLISVITLLLWKVTTRFGKIVLLTFMVAGIGANVGMGFLMMSQTTEVLEDIQDGWTYYPDDIEEFTDDLQMKRYTVGLMRLVDLLLLSLSALVTLLYLNSSVRKAYLGIDG